MKDPSDDSARRRAGAAALRAAWSLAGAAGGRLCVAARTRRRSKSASLRRGRGDAGCRGARRHRAVQRQPGGPAPPLPGAENAGKPGYYTVKPGDTLIRIGLETGQNWRDIARWNGLEQPEPDRGRAGAARGAAGAEPSGVAVRPVAPAGPRRDAAAGRAAAAAAPGARRSVGAPAPAPRRAAAAAGRAARPRRRPQLGLARRRPGGGGLRRRQEQGPGHRRQGRRPGAGRGRRPRGLRRLGPARLRQPGHRQAQRHLPDGLRAQPDAAGEGRPGRAARARRSPRWARATPSACSCTSRSGARASRSTRPSCCRRASGADARRGSARMARRSAARNGLPADAAGDALALAALQVRRRRRPSVCPSGRAPAETPARLGRRRAPSTAIRCRATCARSAARRCSAPRKSTPRRCARVPATSRRGSA